MSLAYEEVLDARPITEEVLSPQQFISLKKEERAKIKSQVIVPPTLGSKNFGGILVKYKTPIYRVG